MSGHKHHFYRIEITGLWYGRWKCACGIKVRAYKDAQALEGK